MEEKLRRCPFCGHWVQFMRDISGEISGIYCTGCKALIKWPIRPAKKTETFGETEQKWVEAYNRGGVQERQDDGTE